MLLRFLCYGFVGFCVEVLWTAGYELATGTRRPDVGSSVRVKMTRGERVRLAGHTTLWMFPIYGSCALLFEPAHDFVRAWPFWSRGLVWAAGLFLVEAVAGIVIKTFTGRIPWDYSYARLSVGGVIRLDYAPVWFVLGLGLERVHDLLRAVEPALRAAI